MKRITTTEEYNDSGKLVKKTVVEETEPDEKGYKYIPYRIPYNDPNPNWPWPPVVTYGTGTGEKPMDMAKLMCDIHL